MNNEIQKIQFSLLCFFALLFIFLNTFLNMEGILTSLALLSLFILIFIFIFNPKIGLLVLIILRVGLDYFRDWDIFIVKDYFILNLGAILGIFILALTLIWIITKREEIFKTPNFLIIFLFLFISLASILSSQYQFTSLKEWIRIASFFAIYFLTFYLIKSKNDLQLVQKTFLVSAIIPCFMGLWQIITKTGLSDESSFLRIYGNFTQPNVFSYFLVIILTLLIYFFITVNNQKIKKIYLLFIILNFILLILTYSRGAWLAFSTILLLLGVLKYRKLLLKSLVIIFLSVVLILSINWFIPKDYNSSSILNFNPSRRITESFSLKQNSSISWRIELWGQMLNVFWEKPILGHGIGSFEKESFRKRGFYAGSYEAHNDYLRLAIELGLVGLTIYILLILIILKNIIKIYKNLYDEDLKIFCLCFLCLFVSLFLASFIENILRNTIIQWLFWSWAALVFKSQKIEQKLYMAK